MISVISRWVLILADIFRSFQHVYPFTCPSSWPGKHGRRPRYHSQSWSWARLCHTKLEESRPALPTTMATGGLRRALPAFWEIIPGVEKTTDTWYNSRRPGPSDHQTWRTVTHSYLGHTPGGTLILTLHSVSRNLPGCHYSRSPGNSRPRPPRTPECPPWGKEMT